MSHYFVAPREKELIKETEKRKNTESLRMNE